MTWWRKPQVGERSTYLVTRWVFLRALGVIYLIAFASLGVQILGLIGSQGILPAEQLLRAAREQLGPERYWQLPTLGWFMVSDRFLQAMCWGGAVLSALLIVDIAPALILALLWVDYLSLTTLCREFLWFQWDSLLLETGFLTMFFAPLRLLPTRAGDPPPSPVMRWWLWWLLFRLMCSSGVVKFASGDLTWHHLTALTYHYETQPLPTWIGWYVHQLPVWFHTLSCALMFATELFVPWLIFAPRRLRLAGCAALVGFQLLIAATGNYTFFNLLTIALCCLLLDDAAWPRWLRERWEQLSGRQATVRVRAWPRAVIGLVSTLLVLLSTVPILALARGGVRLPQPLVTCYRSLEPFRLVNTYGLFAVMTIERDEIIVEGSRDGQTWLAYEFTDKPGDLRHPPRFIAPHQPRLDWQMWFAALGRYQDNPWFLSFCRRLLESSPQVLALLAHNPFPDLPPRYIRAVMYHYRFTDLATKRTQGTWWRRELKGLYCPILTLHRD